MSHLYIGWCKDDSGFILSITVNFETINPQPPPLCQAWPAHLRDWDTRWLSCPITMKPSACWLFCPLKRTPLCPVSSHTSAQPQWRAGPHWCTWEKSACSSPSKAHACNLLSKVLWLNVMLNLCPCTCVFYVCRFTADSEVDLEKPLTALGITDMFSEGKADFRNLSEWKHSQSKPKSASEYLPQVYLDRRKAST